jgi:type II secretory pathway component GspD/PulD (secretin)
VRANNSIVAVPLIVSPNAAQSDLKTVLQAVADQQSKDPSTVSPSASNKKETLQSMANEDRLVVVCPGSEPD